jgi:hypothetical protein
MIGRKRSRHASRIASTRRQTAIALRVNREVNEHDAVLFDDADQQNDADQRDQAEIKAERHQCREGAEPCRRQGREDRQRMDVALIEHAQDDVDDDDRGGDEKRLAGQRGLEGLRVALEIADQGGRRADLRLGVLDRCCRLTEREHRLPG